MHNPIINFFTKNLEIGGCVDADFRLIIINLGYEHLDGGALRTDDYDGFPAFSG